MRYQVKLTAQAIGQIEETVQYLSQIVFMPETARRWADTLQCEIGKLALMPSRHPLTEEEPWRTGGIRKMRVKNFLVYYLIDEKEKTVWVTAVLYARRDQLAALLDLPPEDDRLTE